MSQNSSNKYFIISSLKKSMILYTYWNLGDGRGENPVRLWNWLLTLGTGIPKSSLLFSLSLWDLKKKKEIQHRIDFSHMLFFYLMIQNFISYYSFKYLTCRSYFQALYFHFVDHDPNLTQIEYKLEWKITYDINHPT